MKLSIERNRDVNNRAEIPYFVVVEIVQATAEAGRRYTIPVYVTYVGRKKHFHVEICGFRLDTDLKPETLCEPVKDLCFRLLNVARFPSYMFIARRAKSIFPVYTFGSEVVCTTPGGGPVFRHVELAKVRQYLTHYLHQVNILGKDGKSDKLHVRGVNQHTLGLRRPVLYLKKRAPGENDFWAPVFESGDGKRIYAHAANERREAFIGNGQEVLALHAVVARALHEDGRLNHPFDLRPDRLMPHYWARLEQTLCPEESRIVDGHTVPLYRSQDGRCWLGLEVRQTEDRYGLYLGRDVDEVCGRVREDLARRGELY